MRQIVLPGTSLRVSRLSFGTASLHLLHSSRRRQDVLAASFDSGFTHFDTAPSYGYGLAEEELGRFLYGRLGRVTIATKVGLYAPSRASSTTASVWARKLTGKLIPRTSALVVDWSSGAATKSLDTSLRRLKTHHIDLLLLHEPIYGAFDYESFIPWFEREHARGRLRAWGMAGVAARMGAMISNKILAPVLQVRDSLEQREADLIGTLGRTLQITYGYLQASKPRLDVVATMREALRRNRAGSILVSSRYVKRIAELAQAAELEKVAPAAAIANSCQR